MTNVHSAKQRQTDVVIVGAGLAGLAAARALTTAGVDVIVLEARECVGGRVYTRAASNGTLLDLGAQWIGPTQQRIVALAEAVGVTTFPTYVDGLNIEYRDGQRATYADAIPMNDPIATMEMVETLLELNLMAQDVPLDAPWTAERAVEWDAQTVASWMEIHVSSEIVRMWLTLAVQAVFAAEPRDLSLLHFLFYVHSGGSLNELISVTRGAQELRFREGAQSIADRVAAQLGARVILNAPVHTVVQDDQSVIVASDSVTVAGKYAIIAIPPTLAGRLRYRPKLPAHRDQLTQRVPMGTVIKVHCLYDTPFWRDDGLSGQVASDSGIVRVTFDNSPESGRPGVLLGFIEGDEGRAWGRRSVDERRTAVLECLVRYFGDKAGAPLEYVEQNWTDEEYTRGCYAGYLPPGVMSMYGDALREPIGRLHWAGTETATVWNGYMDGAVQSGERAAAEILARL